MVNRCCRLCSFITNDDVHVPSIETVRSWSPFVWWKFNVSA
jgi:hypothetical protein